MKIKAAFLLTTILLSSFLLVAQEYDQVVYVASKSGLVVRSLPNKNGTALGALALNDPVKYRPSTIIDTIDMRIAYWVEYEGANGLKGYVFGGYLNTYLLPKEIYVSLREYIEHYVLDNFKELTTTRHVDDKPGDKFDETTIASIGLDYYQRTFSQWEYTEAEFLFNKIGINEVLNLIAYGELDGEKVEYSLLKQSYEKSRNLSRFKYRHAINDPPEDEVVIEALYPKGVRIRIAGGL